MLRSYFFLVTFLLGLSLYVPCTKAQDDCAAGVNQCVDTAFTIFTDFAEDRDRLCSGTNDFLACVINETKSCDRLIAASIKDSMSPMVSIYTTDPYNCLLESSTTEALQSDYCSDEMSLCSVYYFQATSESHHNYKSACSMFEFYLGCMQKNTTSCGGEELDFIRDHTANATREFDKAPYYCEERLSYRIDEVDKNMTGCNDIMETMDIRVLKQDYICGYYRNFFNCAIGVLAKASPRQFGEYIISVNEISYTFRVQPYFCESDEPCMDLFKTCNASARSPDMTPCELMDVYTTCLTSGLTACAEADYATVASVVQERMADIHNKYNCIEENKNKMFDDVTTPQSETMTEASVNHAVDSTDNDGHGSNHGVENNNIPGPETQGTTAGDNTPESGMKDGAHNNAADKNNGQVTAHSGSDTNMADATADNMNSHSDGGMKSTNEEDKLGAEVTNEGPKTDGSNAAGKPGRQLSPNNNDGNGSGLLMPGLNWQLVVLCSVVIKAMIT